MRWGGSKKWQRVVGAAVVLAGVVVLGAPAAPAEDATANLWALVRSADGHLEVVRGADAATAHTDALVGRPGPAVLSVEQDQPVHALDAADPLRPQQWALDKVAYGSTWGVTRGGGVTVAVIDTGVLGSHEDLAGSVIPGMDYASDAGAIDPGKTGMVDPDGHGTHVAGVIAAHVRNGLGIAGAAPDARILPIRVLDAHGSGVASNVALGIIWAVDHGARVINMSLGGGPSPGLEDTMQYALDENVVMTAAAGNNFQTGNQPVYPAAYPEALAVAAVNSSLGHAPFSNAGGYVDIAAPGDLILSTYGTSRTDYEWMSGTSMAAPYAAAEAALVISENKSLTSARVMDIMKSTAIDLGPPGKDPYFGYGLVNPRGAVLAAMPTFNNGTKGNGYFVVGADGSVRAYGWARWYGDLANTSHTGHIVAGARTPDGHGYWLAGSDGAVYSFGNARYYGGMYPRHLNGSIVGIAATPTGKGYVLLGSDGGIFTFGDAKFYGSTGDKRLNAPVLDMTMSRDGRGYWLCARDGGIFTFGDAPFRGSTGAMRLAAPVQSMTSGSGGNGYWMVASDGGIFAFAVPFEGSLPAVRGLLPITTSPSVRMRAIATDDGYYILAMDGTVYAFGAARNWGSAWGVWAVDLMQMP
jgi:subtilisin family serine protease